MIKEELYASINKRYGELKHALEGTDLKRIKELALEVHAMVHPAEVSGRGEKTIADYVLEYMLSGNQNELVPRERYDNFRSVWLLVFWGRLTRGGMILTPLTSHHMMHLQACLER